MTNTLAMRVRQVLSANGIYGNIIRLPAGISLSGCSFGVEIAPSDITKAGKVLNVSDVSYGKIILID